MRSALAGRPAALAILAMSPLLAYAAGEKSFASLKNLERELPPTLAHPRLTPESRLRLDATAALENLSSVEQLQAIRTACEKWRAVALPRRGEPDPELLVVWPGGGTWWRCSEGGGSRLAEWDDLMAPYARQPQHGQVFLFGGGQFSFGSSSGWGLTVGAGTTLFQERANVALGQSFSGGGGSASYTLGASGRLRFPIDERLGWNVGPQLQVAIASSSTTFTAAALGGINYLVSTGGSLDVTASVATNGSFGLLTGFTFFLGSP